MAKAYGLFQGVQDLHISYVHVVYPVSGERDVWLLLCYITCWVLVRSTRLDLLKNSKIHQRSFQLGTLYHLSS